MKKVLFHLLRLEFAKAWESLKGEPAENSPTETLRNELHSASYFLRVAQETQEHWRREVIKCEEDIAEIYTIRPLNQSRMDQATDKLKTSQDRYRMSQEAYQICFQKVNGIQDSINELQVHEKTATAFGALSDLDSRKSEDALRAAKMEVDKKFAALKLEELANPVTREQEKEFL